MRKGNFFQGEQVIRYPASNPCYKRLLRSQRARILTASSNGCSGWPSSASWRSCFSELTQFKLHLQLAPTHGLTLHFNSPSRRFHLGVIALVVTEMKRQGRLVSIPLKGHHAVLALLNETVGGAVGSSAAELLLARIYKKWQHALPNLEEAPPGPRQEKGLCGGRRENLRPHRGEKDGWANLFEYHGSLENVRLKFALDRIGATLEDVALHYEDAVDAEAWERFIATRKGKEGEEGQTAPDHRVAEGFEGPAPPVGRKGRTFPDSYRRVALMAAIVGVLGTVALTLAFTMETVSVKPAPRYLASPAKRAAPLPEKPSVAVLPFANLSEDPQEAVQDLRMNPTFSLDYYAKLPEFQDQTEREKVIGVLRLAGLK